jgi:hypothetical protein
MQFRGLQTKESQGKPTKQSELQNGFFSNGIFHEMMVVSKREQEKSAWMSRMLE